MAKDSESSISTKRPPNLLICPLPFELKSLKKHLETSGARFEVIRSQPIVIYQSELFSLALSGLGKAQSALQAEYLVKQLEPKTLILVGSAAALSPNLEVGSIVSSTETLEWGFYPSLDFDKKDQLQTFKSSSKLSRLLISATTEVDCGHWQEGPIVCAEENLVSADRAAQIFQKTKGLALAWEGAGPARVARFNNLDFVEVRVISDKPAHQTVVLNTSDEEDHPQKNHPLDLAQIKTATDSGLQLVARVLELAFRA